MEISVEPSQGHLKSENHHKSVLGFDNRMLKNIVSRHKIVPCESVMRQHRCMMSTNPIPETLASQLE